MRDHPAFNLARTAIADLRDDQTAWVAGRLIEARPSGGRGLLRDASGLLDLTHLPAGLAPWDIVACRGTLGPRGFAVAEARRLVRPKRPQPAAPAAHHAARDAALRATRAFFHGEGFTEVTTPTLVAEPGTDVHLDPFVARFTGMGAEHPPQTLYLHTSPEFAMKALLAEGLERIVQVATVYRNGEWTGQHNPEFTMVEWYRAFADYRPIMDDVEHVVRAVTEAVTGGTALTRRGHSIDVSAPFERVTFRAAFLDACGLDVLVLSTADALRDAARDVGLPPLVPGGTWEDLVHELLITHVEPRLGHTRPTFLIDYPRQLAVLSRAKDADPRVAERFELYIHGVELCNGFTELNDPDEQRARFQDDQHTRTRLGLPHMPLPSGLLAALEAGMPPSGGVALGFDRLLMLALGADDLDNTLLRPS